MTADMPFGMTGSHFMVLEVWKKHSREDNTFALVNQSTNVGLVSTAEVSGRSLDYLS